MSPKPRRVRALLVEDDEENRTVYEIYLPILGINVLSVSDGKEALAEIPRFNPDVILLDLRMPNMDGWEFMRVYEGPVPIIVISGYSDMTELPRIPYAAVMKPGNMKEVAVLVKAAAASWRK